MNLASHFLILLFFFHLSNHNTPQSPKSVTQSLSLSNYRSFTNQSYNAAAKLQNNDTRKKMQSCRHSLNTPLIKCITLLAAGDIESNPGPRTPKYPCRICSKNCSWQTPAVQCDDCDGWYQSVRVRVGTTRRQRSAWWPTGDKLFFIMLNSCSFYYVVFLSIIVKVGDLK